MFLDSCQPVIDEGDAEEAKLHFIDRVSKILEDGLVSLDFCFRLQVISVKYVKAEKQNR